MQNLLKTMRTVLGGALMMLFLGNRSGHRQAILNYQRHGEGIVTDAGLVGIQVDSFYQENAKWCDSPCGLDSNTMDYEDNGFRDGEIL